MDMFVKDVEKHHYLLEARTFVHLVFGNWKKYDDL
jgi:hypothetical protein